VNPKKKKSVEVKWVRDPTLSSNEEKLIPLNSGAIIELHAAPGLSSAEVKAPTMPGTMTNVARSMLKAMYDCKGNGIDELGFKAGDLITILKDVEGGWYEGELKGKRGFVPETYVEKIKVAADGKVAGPAAAKTTARTATTTKVVVSVSAAAATPSSMSVPIGRPAALSIGMRAADKKQLQAQAAKPVAAARVSEWKEVYTETGEKYYWNEKLQQSEWELPASELALMVKAEAKKAADTNRCTTPGCTNVKLSGKQHCVTHLSKATGAARAATTTTTAAKTAAVRLPTATTGAGAGTSASGTTPAAAAKTVARSVTTAAAATTATATGGVKANVTVSGGGSVGRGATVTVTGAAKVTPAVVKAPVAKPAIKKKSDWSEEWDDASQAPYWYNAKTGESSWDKPADL